MQRTRTAVRTGTASLRTRFVALYGGELADVTVGFLAFVFAIEADVAIAAQRLAAVLALSAITAIVSIPVRRWAMDRFRLESDSGLRIIGILASALFAALIVRNVIPAFTFVPSSALLLGAALAGLGSGCSRVAFRNYRTIFRTRSATTKMTIVVGARDAAAAFINATKRKPEMDLHVVGCVDEEVFPRRVSGVPMLGRIEDLPELVERHRVEVVIVAVNDATEDFVKRVESMCAAGDKSRPAPIIRVMPGASTLLTDRARRTRRELRSEDVLHREVNQVDVNRVRPHIENQVVLVTGAGGSIGSEICRQVAALNPKELILLGHGENSLFVLQHELRNERHFNMTKIVLADVTDPERIRDVFSLYRPNIVFHAAAHKHVPILEHAPCEGARNNVLGTHNVALAAAASGVAKFILLSTDKAVNPTSVMGATKRVAELVCQSFAQRTSTEFVSVRFGNVLGSRGSVLPTFQRQVELGGPVTITHRDMERFFMTIPEAVSLVLQAMSIGRDGQVFVLDMGKPVKILDLAEKVIRLSGYVPYREVDVVEVGIRPGEKLFEEILTSGEGMARTPHDRLFIAQQERLDYNDLAVALRTLRSAIAISDRKTVIRTLLSLVPSYVPDQRWHDALAAAPEQAEQLEQLALQDEPPAELLITQPNLLPPSIEVVEAQRPMVAGSVAGEFTAPAMTRAAS